MRRNLPFLVTSALVLAILVTLGNWQVRRLGEKQAYLGAIEDRLKAAPAEVPVRTDAEKAQFLSVKVTGEFVGPEVHVLVSTRDYGAGYRIIQAFEADGRRFMVDRGYIRLESKDVTREAGKAQVVGNLHWPDERDSFTPQNDFAANIWYARDVSALAQALGTERRLIIASKTVPNDATILPLPLDTSTIPNRHLEYIITWYGLAAVWVLMSLYFLSRRPKKDT